MSSRKRPLGHHLHVRIDEARIDRGWRAIEARLPQPHPRRSLRPLALALAVVLSLAAAILWIRRPASEAVIEGAVLASSQTEQETIELVDGSRLVLEPSTRLRLVHVSARRVHLTLEEGTLDAFVTHVEGRPFTVLAGKVEVRVVGTRFRVSVERDDVSVSVDEGRVALRGLDGMTVPAFLSAGEAWSSATPPSEEAETLAPSLELPQTNADPNRGTPRRNGSRGLPARFHSLYAAGRYDEAYASVEPARFQRALETASARDLFALASAARLSGHGRDAARAFDALRRRHRDDPRAGLAALELGRLRLYELDDPAGAAEAFEDAINLQPDAFFREDAEARRVQALQAAGQLEACAKARDEYLQRFPSGLHSALVSQRCR